MAETKHKTKPKPLWPSGVVPDARELAHGRYGTDDTVRIWGPEKTFQYSLRTNGVGMRVLSVQRPDLLHPEIAREIEQKTGIDDKTGAAYVSPERIRALEADTGHDIIAITRALEEQVSEAAKPHVGDLRTSADTTQTARALQFKESLEVIADSVENLRDITIEKACLWKDVLWVDTTHLLDALPGVAGRAFAHYAEMLQSGLEFLWFVYQNSIKGKWADATGNHHSAKLRGIDGVAFEDAYCKELGIGHMVAPAQIPGLEFEADVMYVLVRISETLNNLARYVTWGKSSDANVFKDINPKKRKGSSAMPHKDAVGGNPDTEEQDASWRNLLQGYMSTALANCEFPYARALYGSASGRIIFDDAFKALDQGIRRLASAVYYLEIDLVRSEERVFRTYGIVTAQVVLNYLTDRRLVDKPLARSVAHDIIGELATQAWREKKPFADMLLGDVRVTSRLTEEQIREATNPLRYTGESQRIIELVAKKCYGKKTISS